jgi:hypothetical protein
MSDIQRKTAENGVLDLKENLKEMQKNMHIFPLSMRALYTDKAVGTSTDAACKFRKLRDDTRNYAMVYLKCILPISTKFVMSIKEYFANYDCNRLKKKSGIESPKKTSLHADQKRSQRIEISVSSVLRSSASCSHRL